MARELRRLDRGVHSRLTREVRKLEPPAAQPFGIGKRRPDEVLNTGGARLLHRCDADLGLLRHLRGIPEIGDQEGAVCAIEGSTQAARLEQIALHHLDAAPLERCGRLARRVAADDANCVLAGGQQRVDDTAALSTGTTNDCNGLRGHVRLLSVGAAEPAAEVPSFLSRRISAARSVFESPLAAKSIAVL